MIGHPGLGRLARQEAAVAADDLALGIARQIAKGRICHLERIVRQPGIADHRGDRTELNGLKQFVVHVRHRQRLLRCPRERERAVRKALVCPRSTKTDIPAVLQTQCCGMLTAMRSFLSRQALIAASVNPLTRVQCDFCDFPRDRRP